MNCTFCRRNVWSDPLLADRLANYTKSSDGVKRVREWTAGTIGHYAGYHCSWCYHPEGIRTKLVAAEHTTLNQSELKETVPRVSLRLLSAQKHDSPRWGDYPEKTNAAYIAGLIESGEWFDGTSPFISVEEDGSRFYAPEFFLERREKYRYLLQVPHSYDESHP